MGSAKASRVVWIKLQYKIKLNDDNGRRKSQWWEYEGC